MALSEFGFAANISIMPSLVRSSNRVALDPYEECIGYVFTMMDLPNGADLPEEAQSALAISR